MASNKFKRTQANKQNVARPTCLPSLSTTGAKKFSIPGVLKILQIALVLILSAGICVNYSDVLAAKIVKSAKKSKRQTGAGDVWQRVRQGLRIPVFGPTYAGVDALLNAASAPIAIRAKTSSETNNPEGNSTALPPNATGGKRLTTVIARKAGNPEEPQLADKLRSRHVISPKNSHLFKSDATPEERYTVLGRAKLAPKSYLIAKKPAAQTEANATAAAIGKSPLIERIRTRLNFHPELTKKIVETPAATAMASAANGKNSNGQTQANSASASNCADLGRKEVIKLAQQGALPTAYFQAAEQCRQKKSEIHARIDRQIAGFRQKIGFVNQSAERARPYLFHVVDSLTKYGMPLDLALLPIVESGYQPTALSPMSAAGIWQFIPSTGRDYGLEQNGDYDARLDITAATQAAARFLSGLKDRYNGDWLLALAAYNCGPGCVDAAIAQNRAAGLDTDYWSLNLPAETQDYVPRLLALSHIFANPVEYGLRLRPLGNEPYFIKIEIAHDLDIQQLYEKDFEDVAKLAGLSTTELGFLNTAYLKAAITRNKPFSLLMPIRNANLLHQSLAYFARSNLEQATSKTTEIALIEDIQKHSFTEFVAKIEQPLLAIDPAEIAPPVQPRQFLTELEPAERDRNDYLSVHYLDKGETLKSIAEENGMNEAALREFNRLKRKQKIGLGFRLLIPNAAEAKQTRSSILFKTNAVGLKG